MAEVDGPNEAVESRLSIRPASLRLNAAASVLGNLLFFSVVLVVTPIAIAHLGEERWGIWQLISATVAYAQLLTLNLATAIHYQAAYRTATGDLVVLANAVRNVRLYLLLVGLLLVGLTAVVGPSLIQNLVREPLFHLAWAAFLVSMIITALDFQIRFYGSVLAGLQRMDLLGVFQAVGAACLFASVMLGFRYRMGLVGFAALMVAAPMVTAVCARVAVGRFIPRRVLSEGRWNASLFAQMLNYSAGTILFSVGSVALFQTMRFTASLTCGGPVAAGQLGLAISLAQGLSVLFTPAATALLSRVGQLHAEKRFEQVTALAEQSVTLVGLLIVPCIAFLVFEADTLLGAWLEGTESLRALGPITISLQFLAFGTGAFIYSLPLYYVLLGVGRHVAFGVGILAAAVLSTVLGLAFTSVWPEIGAIAAAYAVTMVGLLLGVALPATLKHFPIRTSRLVFRSVLLPSIATTPALLCLALLGSPRRDATGLLWNALCFGLVAAPAIEIVRRRLALRLR